MYDVENPANINPNIPSNLYQAKIWCILLEEQSQCPWISFTGPTELKRSFPLWQNWTTQIVSNSICDETQIVMKLKLWWKKNKKKAQIVMNLKNLNGDKTQKLKLWQNSKTQIVTKLKVKKKLKNWKCDKIQMVTKLENSNNDKTQKLKMWQNLRDKKS